MKCVGLKTFAVGVIFMAVLHLVSYQEQYRVGCKSWEKGVREGDGQQDRASCADFDSVGKL